MIIEGTARIAAPRDQVFDVLADPARWFDVDPSLVDVSPRARIALGSGGIVTNRRVLGMTATVTWTTTAFDPPARLTQLLRGMGYELTEAVDLRSMDGGTEMRVVDTLIPTSLGGRLMVALSRGIMQRDLERRFMRLKTLMEPGAR